jgi:hypothetical protein
MARYFFPEPRYFHFSMLWGWGGVCNLQFVPCATLDTEVYDYEIRTPLPLILDASEVHAVWQVLEQARTRGRDLKIFQLFGSVFPILRRAQSDVVS